MERLAHPIPPLYDASSRILILGSFPSVKSREACFFYHHPQNRFWKVLANIFNEPLPVTIAEKSSFLHSRHIALWDVIGSCVIAGSSDSSIKNVTPNNLAPIISGSAVRQVFLNGGTSLRYYREYQEKDTGIAGIGLPSTSPANAAWTLPRLCEAWSVILDYLGD